MAHLVRWGILGAGEVNAVGVDLSRVLEHDPRRRLFDPKVGGGALLGLGVHTAVIAWLLLARPDAVSDAGSAAGSRTERHPLPAGNGYGLESAEIEKCLAEGLTDGAGMPLAASLGVLEALDHVRRQVGVRYPDEEE